MRKQEERSDLERSNTMFNSFTYYELHLAYGQEGKEYFFQKHLLSPSCVWERVDLPFWERLAKENRLQVYDASSSSSSRFKSLARDNPVQLQIVKRAESSSLYELEEKIYSSGGHRANGLLEYDFSWDLTAREVELAHACAGRSLLLPEVLRAWLEEAQHLAHVEQQHYNFLVSLQKLYLQGFFDWSSAIGKVEEVGKGFIGLGSNSMKRGTSFPFCRRCGYAEEKQDTATIRGRSSLVSKLGSIFAKQESVIKVECETCGQENCYYCPHCLHMGRAKACTALLHWVGDHVGLQQARKSLQKVGSKEQGVVFQWTGELSPAQEEASQQLADFVQTKRQERRGTSNNQSKHSVERERKLNKARKAGYEFLIWAVCGAGKTEILFQTIYQSLLQEEKILITSPRRDVILELAPRLQEVFPSTSIRTLHAESKEKFAAGEIFLATAHQTLRFHNFFDLVIIDEEDAFPYHHEPMLADAVARAQKESACVVYLTATPRPQMIRAARQYRLAHILISKRYHGFPLAVPQLQPVGDWRKQIRQGVLLTPLVNYVRHLVSTGRFGYLFVPHVHDLSFVERYLKEMILPCLKNEFFSKLSATNAAKNEAQLSSLTPVSLKDYVIEVVHAGHPERTAIVQRFRAGQIHLLLTTTILERGVTIPYSDVAVLGSDDPIFDSAALIQMAGRVGRKLEDPVGQVWFFPEVRNKAQYECMKQIKEWNRR